MGVYKTSLFTLAQRSSRAVPAFLEKCFKFLLTKANLCNDIFKIPGNEREIERLVDVIEASGDVEFPPNTSPHVVAALIMRFLEQIPNHLLVDKHVSKWKEIPTVPTNDKEPYVYIRHFLKKLPTTNLLILSRVFAFFKIFAKYESITNVTAEEIAEILAPVIIVDNDDKDYVTNPEIVMIMIKNYKKIFFNCYSISKKKFLSSTEYEEAFFKQISQEFFNTTTSKGLVNPTQETFESKKMFRVVDIQRPSLERLLGNLLSRERREHAQVNSTKFSIK